MTIWSVVAEATPGVWALALIEGLCLIAILTVLLWLGVRRSGPPPVDTQHYEQMLLRLGEARGRQEVLDDVRMLEHGQLKTHVLAVQRCLTLARDAASVEQRDQWLDEGLSQARRLLEVVVMLHQAVGTSALPSDLERTVVDVTQSLAVAYPRARCQVEVAGRRPGFIGDSVKRAVILVLYNALNNAYLHGRPAQVAVQLQYAPDALILVVCDDGQGMPPAGQRSGGRGLRDMRDLVAQHRGTLRIVSEPGAGTQMRVTFPLDEAGALRERSCDAAYSVSASARA